MLVQDTDTKSLDAATLSECQKVSSRLVQYRIYEMKSPTQHFVYLDLSYRVSRNDIMADQ